MKTENYKSNLVATAAASSFTAGASAIAASATATSTATALAVEVVLDLLVGGNSVLYYGAFEGQFLACQGVVEVNNDNLFLYLIFKANYDCNGYQHDRYTKSYTYNSYLHHDRRQILF